MGGKHQNNRTKSSKKESMSRIEPSTPVPDAGTISNTAHATPARQLPIELRGLASVVANVATRLEDCGDKAMAKLSREYVRELTTRSRKLWPLDLIEDVDSTLPIEQSSEADLREDADALKDRHIEALEAEVNRFREDRDRNLEWRGARDKDSQELQELKARVTQDRDRIAREEDRDLRNRGPLGEAWSICFHVARAFGEDYEKAVEYADDIREEYREWIELHGPDVRVCDAIQAYRSRDRRGTGLIIEENAKWEEYEGRLEWHRGPYTTPEREERNRRNELGWAQMGLDQSALSEAQSSGGLGGNPWIWSPGTGNQGLTSGGKQAAIEELAGNSDRM